MSASLPYGDPPHGNCLLHGPFVGTWTCPSCQSPYVHPAVNPSFPAPAPLTEERIRQIIREELERDRAASGGSPRA